MVLQYDKFVIYALDRLYELYITNIIQLSDRVYNVTFPA
jgi:hypothetical protein